MIESIQLGSAQPAVVKLVLPEYLRWVRRHERWLEQQGRRSVQAAAAEFLPGGSSAGSSTAASTAPVPPSWLKKFTDPVIGPFSAGAKAEAMIIARPYVYGALAILAATAGAVYFVIRRSDRQN